MEIKKTIEETKEYIGMWVTEDNHVRHDLLPNGRYDEARGKEESAYQGNYWVKGNHIEYRDDTGFTANGDFKEGILYHGGMILYKKKIKISNYENKSDCNTNNGVGLLLLQGKKYKNYRQGEWECNCRNKSREQSI